MRERERESLIIIRAFKKRKREREREIGKGSELFELLIHIVEYFDINTNKLYVSLFFLSTSNNQVLKVCKIIRFNPYTNLKTYVSYDSTYFYNEIYLHDLKIKKNAMSTTFFITNSKWHVVIVGAKKVISVIGSNLNL